MEARTAMNREGPVAQELPRVASSKPSLHAAGTEPLRSRVFRRADGETRTPDPFITSEVLYQLSYVGTGAPKERAQCSRG
jgi:hypothetical protein